MKQEVELSLGVTRAGELYVGPCTLELQRLDAPSVRIEAGPHLSLVLRRHVFEGQPQLRQRQVAFPMRHVEQVSTRVKRPLAVDARGQIAQMRRRQVPLRHGLEVEDVECFAR